MVTLVALREAGHELAIVVSRVDTRRGRGGESTPSPVKAAALAAGLEVTDQVDDVISADVDLAVVVAFGQLIRPPVLARVPMVNLHFSLLPRWRGAAPVERAILAGDPTTGVCVMALAEQLDTGAVYRRYQTPIARGESADDLRQRLAVAGSALLVDALGTGLGEAVPQVGEATYAAKLTSADRHIGWPRSSEEVWRIVRIGRAWTTFRGRRLLVLDASPATEFLSASGSPGTGTPEPGSISAGPSGSPVVTTGDGGLVLHRVQPEGRGPLSGADWARGARLGPSERLGETPAAPAPPAAAGVAP